MAWRRFSGWLLAGLISCAMTGCGSEPATEAAKDPQAATASEEKAEGKAFADGFESGSTEKWETPDEPPDLSSDGDTKPEP